MHIVIPAGFVIAAVIVSAIWLVVWVVRFRRRRLKKLRAKQEAARLSALERELSPPRRGWLSWWR